MELTIETGLIMPVPSLEEFVASWRPRVDAVAPVGIPAHVTVMYPFLPMSDVLANLAGLQAFFDAQPSFTYSLDSVGWFGQDVVYVRPPPTSGFEALTTAIEAEWGLSPYGGDIIDPVPHVTIGHGGSAQDMELVSESVLPLLPIVDERAVEVWLMQGTPDPPRWARSHRFSLGGPAT